MYATGTLHPTRYNCTTTPPSLTWLIHVNCLYSVRTPLPHPTAWGFWLSQENCPFSVIRHLFSDPNKCISRAQTHIQTWNYLHCVEPCTLFTRTSTLPLLWTSWLYWISHPVALIFISLLLLFFHAIVSSFLCWHNFYVGHFVSLSCILHRHRWFDHANKIWWRIKLTKLLIMRIFASILSLPVSSLTTLPSTLEVYCSSAVLSLTPCFQTQTRLVI